MHTRNGWTPDGEPAIIVVDDKTNDPFPIHVVHLQYGAFG